MYCMSTIIQLQKKKEEKKNRPKPQNTYNIYYWLKVTLNEIKRLPFFGLTTRLAGS